MRFGKCSRKYYSCFTTIFCVGTGYDLRIEIVTSFVTFELYYTINIRLFKNYIMLMR